MYVYEVSNFIEQPMELTYVATCQHCTAQKTNRLAFISMRIVPPKLPYLYHEVIFNSMHGVEL